MIQESNPNGGRPTEKEILYPLIKELIDEEGLSAQEACSEAGIHRSTFYRWDRDYNNGKFYRQKKLHSSQKPIVKRHGSMPSRIKIFKYWRSDAAIKRMKHLSKEADIDFNFHLIINSIHQECFACNRMFLKHKWEFGHKNYLQRCHIVPRQLGGSNHVSNIVLLCRHCHLENPNVRNETAYFKWLQFHKSRYEIINDEVRQLSDVMIDQYKLKQAVSISSLNDIIPDGIDIENYSVPHNGINFSTIVSIMCLKIDEILDEYEEMRRRKGF